MKSRVSPTGTYLFRVQKKRDLAAADTPPASELVRALAAPAPERENLLAVSAAASRRPIATAQRDGLRAELPVTVFLHL